MSSPNSYFGDSPGFFSSDLINLIHFIFYGSIQEERKACLASLRMRVLLHLVSCINLAKGRRETGRRREANWMPFDTEADESSARVLGIRPARQVDALRPVSDKQHFVASVKRVPLNSREWKSNAGFRDCARNRDWREHLRTLSYDEARYHSARESHSHVVGW